jgi:hypothetical protein
MNPPAGSEMGQASDAPDARRLVRYFIPLAVQAASQSLCYPLVSMIAARGPGGPLDLTGLAQSNNILFFLGMLATSLVPTGMVFARTQQGYRLFYRLTVSAGACACIIQALAGAPAVAQPLFEGVLGLPSSIADPAQITLLASIPL